MGIQFGSADLAQGALKTVRVERSDLPGVLPTGSRCQIMGVAPKQLSTGDVVATPDGRFRRFWSTDGKVLWSTDQSGWNHESSAIKDGLVRKVLVSPGALKNVVWLLGATAGRLRRK